MDNKLVRFRGVVAAARRWWRTMSDLCEHISFDVGTPRRSSIHGQSVSIFAVCHRIESQTVQRLWRIPRCLRGGGGAAGLI